MAPQAPLQTMLLYPKRWLMLHLLAP